jgi:hypothetical protein
MLIQIYSIHLGSLIVILLETSYASSITALHSIHSYGYTGLSSELQFF